ncbi:hypothetical protein LA52FAK_34820 [Desulforhopalus sp. 52FAK]
MVSPIIYSKTYSMILDYSQIKYPLGFTFIIVGFYLFYRHNKMQNPKHRIQHWICPGCQDTYVKTGLDRYTCDNCGQALETLDGYYERHPNA